MNNQLADQRQRLPTIIRMFWSSN